MEREKWIVLAGLSSYLETIDILEEENVCAPHVYMCVNLLMYAYVNLFYAFVKQM